MGTKNNPGPIDCYAKAEPDEPIFILLARDIIGSDTVRAWAYARIAQTGDPRDAKAIQAFEISVAMDEWRNDRISARKRAASGDREDKPAPDICRRGRWVKDCEIESDGYCARCHDAMYP